jgi:TP901 family phage tail tape measure protein
MQVAELFARLGFRIDNSGLNNFRNNLNNLANNTQNTVNRMKDAFKGLGLAIASALSVNAFKNMINSANELNDKFLRLRALTKTTGSDFERLKQAVLKAGDITTFNPQEMANTAITMAQAGFNFRDIIASILPVSQFSEATGKAFALDEYASLVTSTFARFNLKTTDANRVVDAFTGAMNSADMNAQDFAYTMKYVGSIAQSAGLSLEEASALIATTATGGIKGSMAGTGLAMILTQLLSPKKSILNELKTRGGIDLYQGGKLKNIGTIITDISRYLKTLTDREKTPFLKELVGQNALAEALYLFQNPQVFAKTLGIIQGSQGITQKTAEASMSALTKAQSNLEGAITNLKDVIYQELAPNLALMIEGLGSIVKGIGGLVKEISKFRNVFMIFMVLMLGGLISIRSSMALMGRFRLPTLGGGLGSFMSTLGDLPSLGGVAFEGMKIAFNNMIQSMEMATTGFIVLTKAGFGSLFAFIKANILPLIMIISGLALVIEDLYVFSQGGNSLFGEFLKDGAPELQAMYGLVLLLKDEIISLSDSIAKRFGGSIKNGTDLLKQLGKIAYNTFMFMIVIIESVVVSILYLTDKFMMLIEKVSPGFKFISSTLSTIGTKVREWLPNINTTANLTPNNIVGSNMQQIKNNSINNNITINTNTDNPLSLANTIKKNISNSVMYAQ